MQFFHSLIIIINFLERENLFFLLENRKNSINNRELIVNNSGKNFIHNKKLMKNIIYVKIIKKKGTFLIN